MLYRWFGEKAGADARNNPRVFDVKWDWVLSYTRSQLEYLQFTRKPSSYEGDTANNIYNHAAEQQLTSYLQQDGKFTSQREEFNYSKLEPYQRIARSFNFRSVSPPAAFADGLYAALGAFTLRALAAGYTEPIAGGLYRITVTNVWVFVFDEFSFEGRQDLGFWSCEDKAYTIDPLKGLRPGYSNVTNADFRDYRERHGYGRDFMVASKLHEVEDFEGMSYTYLI